MSVRHALLTARTATRLAVASAAIVSTALVAPAAHAGPTLNSSRSSCTGWQDNYYSAWQSKLCVNVSKYSSGDVRLMSTLYVRKHTGGLDGHVKGRASIKRGSGGTLYRTSYHYKSTSQVGYDKSVQLARATHWYTSSHSTAYAAATVTGVVDSKSGGSPMVWTTKPHVHRAY